jgi:hypothetical protein
MGFVAERRALDGCLTLRPLLHPERWPVGHHHLAVPGVCTREPQGLGTCRATLRWRTHLPGAGGLRGLPAAAAVAGTAPRGRPRAGPTLRPEPEPIPVLVQLPGG